MRTYRLSRPHKLTAVFIDWGNTASSWPPMRYLLSTFLQFRRRGLNSGILRGMLGLLLAARWFAGCRFAVWKREVIFGMCRTAGDGKISPTDLRRMMKPNGGVRIGNDDSKSRMAATIMRRPPAAKGTLATFRIVVPRGPPHHAKRQGCS